MKLVKVLSILIVFAAIALAQAPLPLNTPLTQGSITVVIQPFPCMPTLPFLPPTGCAGQQQLISIVTSNPDTEAFRVTLKFGAGATGPVQYVDRVAGQISGIVVPAQPAITGIVVKELKGIGEQIIVQ